jgi:hypothetical protein
VDSRGRPDRARTQDRPQVVPRTAVDSRGDGGPRHEAWIVASLLTDVTLRVVPAKNTLDAANHVGTGRTVSSFRLVAASGFRKSVEHTRQILALIGALICRPLVKSANHHRNGLDAEARTDLARALRHAASEHAVDARSCQNQRREREALSENNQREPRPSGLYSLQ